jgi:hypothetical protein
MGNTLVASTLHWGPDSNHNNYWRTHWKKWVHSMLQSQLLV